MWSAPGTTTPIYLLHSTFPIFKHSTMSGSLRSVPLLSHCAINQQSLFGEPSCNDSQSTCIYKGYKTFYLVKIVVTGTARIFCCCTHMLWHIFGLFCVFRRLYNFSALFRFNIYDRSFHYFLKNNCIINVLYLEIVLTLRTIKYKQRFSLTLLMLWIYSI